MKLGRLEPPRKDLIALTAILLLAAAGFGVAAATWTKPAAAPTAPGLRGSELPTSLTSAPASPFRLRGARGGVIDSDALRGRPYAVTFLFTECPDVCPAIGQQMRLALEDLGPRADEVTVVAVSVDPRNDTPGAVRRWLDRQNLPPNFRYAIGTEQELRDTWEAYFAQPKIRNRPETSTHSAAVWLIDRAGRPRTRHLANSATPADIAHDLRYLLDEPRPG